MENSTSDPAPFTIRLFGLGDPGTGFTIWFHELGEQEEDDNSVRSRCCPFVLFNYSSYVEKMAAGPAMIHALFSAAGIVASGSIILCFYNGKNRKAPKFSKWFSIFFIRHIC